MKRKKIRPLMQEQAWLVVATMFERRSGLCRAIFRLKVRGLLDKKLYDQMSRQIGAEGNRLGQHGWFWDFVDASLQNDETRIAVAEKFAKSGKKK